MNTTNSPAAKENVIFYIDGYNFYYGLKEKSWKRFYWLDLVSFCSKFLKPHQELVAVKYFSAPTKKSGKYRRQNAFFSANKLNHKFHLILGNYLLKDKHCFNCNHVFRIPEEKKTDVNIATEMIADCVYKNCQVTVLISGDSDLTPPINFIKKHDKTHKVIVLFPPARYSSHLKQIAHLAFGLDKYKSRFKKSLLPEEIKLPTHTLQRPKKWR